MKAVIFSATIGLFAALSQAVAIPADVKARQSAADIEFIGVDPRDNYGLTVPTDGTVVIISKPIL